MGERCLEREVEGRRVRFLDIGSGSPVVIAHGLGLSGAFFRERCGALARAGFRAIAPDLPGFGRSEGPRFGQAVPETARWLLAFGDALGLDSAVWVGHSLAAQTVLEVAVRAPHRTRALVLVTPTGAPGGARLVRQAYGFLRDLVREPLSLVPVVAREYLGTTLAVYFGTWLKAARDRPVEKAHRVRCATLLVTGRHDPMVPEAYIAALARRIPAARVVRLHGAGHGIVFDRSGEFDRALVAFLRDGPGQPRAQA